MRLDSFLSAKSDVKSRTYASRLIKDGLVLLNGKICLTPSKEVDENAEIEILKADSFASFGGEKLQKAIDCFKIDVKGQSCIDIGCSNGGFTDCLLRHGAKMVVAVDVGECALPKNILDDERVEFLKFNARNLNEQVVDRCDFVCLDCSFISLNLLLDAVYSVLKFDGRAVLLVKPQFEVGKKSLSKKGIVTDKKAERNAIYEIKRHAQSIGFEIIGFTEAPKKEVDKNQEYLLYLKKQSE
ncbi:MAG: TlyA family RNA methyltransferase [Acidaminococcus sp.]|nr:TlyA family RNA methyltransferase [Acidaminococcus sp.]